MRVTVPARRVRVLVDDVSTLPSAGSQQSPPSVVFPAFSQQPEACQFKSSASVLGQDTMSEKLGIGLGRSDNTDLWPAVTLADWPSTSIDLLTEEQSELEHMWKTTTINRYYVPISKLPPLRGDPRRHFGNHAPACYPERSVPRAHRVMERWQSMPQLRPQLAPDDLRSISLVEEMSRGHQEDMPMPLSRGRLRRQAALQRDVGVRICPNDPAAKGSSCEQKEFPHIACKCCKHAGPKPWLDKKTLSAAASALVAAAVAPSDVSPLHSQTAGGDSKVKALERSFRDKFLEL